MWTDEQTRWMKSLKPGDKVTFKKKFKQFFPEQSYEVSQKLKYTNNLLNLIVTNKFGERMVIGLFIDNVYTFLFNRSDISLSEFIVGH